MLRGRFSLGKDLMKGLILIAIYFSNAGHLFQHYLSKRQCTFHLKKIILLKTIIAIHRFDVVQFGAERKSLILITLRR